MKTFHGTQSDPAPRISSSAQALLDALPDRACLLDSDGNIVAVNGGEADGLKVAGQPYARVSALLAGLPSSHQAAVSNGVRSVVAGEQNDFETEFACFDSKRWCRLRVTAARSEDFAALVIHEDVTGRKLSDQYLERAVRDQEDDLRRLRIFQQQLTEYLPDGVIYLASDGMVLGVNRQGHHSLGLSVAELKQRKLSDFQELVIREDGTPYPVAEYPASRCLATGQPQPPGMIGVLRPDGSRRWLLVTAVPAPCPLYPGKTGALATFLDLTDRKRVEEELREMRDDLERRVRERTAELQHAIDQLSESEFRFRQIAEHVGEVVWILQLEPRKLLYISPTYERVFGRPTSEMYERPRSFTEAVIPEDLPQVLASLEARTQHPVDTTYRIQLPSGEVRWMRSRASPIRNEAGVTYRLTGIIEDITDIRRAQEALNRLQQEVLAVTERERKSIGQDLHDGLGQHLTGIAFLSKSLQRRLAEKAAGGIAVSEGEAAEAANIAELIHAAIGQSRALARGLSPVEAIPSGLSSALTELANRVDVVFRIACVFECEGPVMIEDEVMANNLYRIAQEAVTNAMKYAQASNLRIELSEGEADVLLNVTDDGVGLPPIAERGSGMGLGIMRYRAEMIGGSVTVEPRASGGTIVRCTVPKKPGACP